MPEQDPSAQDPFSQEPPEQSPLLSRRAVLTGMAMGAAAPLLLARAQALPTAVAAAPFRLQAAVAASVGSAPLLPRQMHTATPLSSSAILVAGGLSAGGNVLSDAVLVGADGSVRQIAPMLQGRSGHAAVLLPYGRVLVLGGTGDLGPLAEAEVWDPAHNTWTAATPLQMPRYNHSAVRTTANRILVIGGFAQGVVDDVELYLFS
jgi:hypothetical protein